MREDLATVTGSLCYLYSILAVSWGLHQATCFIKKIFFWADMRPPLLLSLLNLANIRDRILLALLPPVLSPLTPNNHQTCKSGIQLYHDCIVNRLGRIMPA